MMSEQIEIQNGQEFPENEDMNIIQWALPYL